MGSCELPNISSTVSSDARNQIKDPSSLSLSSTQREEVLRQPVWLPVLLCSIKLLPES